MTYSRPGTRRSNINRPGALPDVGRILGGVPEQTARTGRLIDKTDVTTAGRIADSAAGNEAAAVSNFLNQIIEPVQKVGEALDINRANRQVGELISSTPNLGTLFRESPDEVRDKIRVLSPRAQDMAYQRLAESAVSRYGETYQASALSNAVLADPTKEAEHSAVDERIKAEARDKAGITNLPPAYVGANALRMAQVEGLVAGKLDKARNKTAGERLDAQAQDAYGKVFEGFAARLEEINESTYEKPEQKVEGTSEAIGEFNQWFKEEAKKVLDGGDQDEQKLLSNNTQGVGQMIAEALVLNDVDRAEATLKAYRLASKGEYIISDGKTNIWDLPVKTANGRSVSVEEWIRQQDQLIERYKDKQYLEMAQEALGGIIKTLITSNDPEEKARARAQLGAAIGQLPVPAIPDAIQLAGVAEGFEMRETREQLQAFRDLVYSDEFKGLSPEEQGRRVQQQVALGNINPVRGLNYEGRMSEISGDDVAQTFASNSRKQADQLDTNADAINRFAGVNERYLEKTTSSEDNTQALINQSKGRAEASTAKIVRERQAAGESIDREESDKIFNEELAKELKKLEESRLDGIRDIENPGAETRKQINQYFQSRAKGLSRLESIPASIRREFKNNNFGDEPTEKNLLRYFIGKLTQVQRPDGTFEFGKNRAAVKTWFGTNDDRAVKGQPVQSTQPTNRGSRNRFNKRDERKDQSNSQTSGDQATGMGGPSLPDVAMAGLETIANVFTPVAKAGTLTANQEQLALMQKLWERREPLTLNTPPLPQVVPEAVAQQPVSIAISTPNHPFFVAIGIAEGTRTAKGGYTKAYYGHTDPGDGNRNMGTVSGGRNGESSPQQVDRNWMATLTRTQMQFGPILRKVGLDVGTQGYNRMMFNILDLNVQAPAAVRDFVQKLPQIISGGLTVEAIAKARADSFFTPSGRLDAPGFNNSYQRLYSDQRSRAGVWDYRRRL